MGLIPSFADGGTGISVASVGNLIKRKLESTWDASKTAMNIRYDGSKKEIYFDSSNQDFKADKAMGRPVVVRVQTQRTVYRDLEIGNVMIRYLARPVIHVFAYDVAATTNSEVSDLLEDMAQYIRAWVQEDPSRFHADGIHSLVGVEDNWIPNNGDPNWHHWIMVCEAEFEMRRDVDTEAPEFMDFEFIDGEFLR